MSSIYRGSADTSSSHEGVSSVNIESDGFFRLDDQLDKEQNFHESHGLRVTPSYLEFTAVFDGEKFKKEVEIRNISQKKIEIFLKQPVSMAFEVIDRGTKIPLAPGLAVKKTVVFQYRPDTLLSSFFTIRIKTVHIEIPTFFKRAHTQFMVTPPFLDFGKVDLGSPLASRLVTMRNLASFAAQYKIVIGPNENHIQVVPCKGFIRPNETQILKVQFYPTVPGQICQVLNVMPPSSNAQGDWRQKHDIFCTITLEADIIKPSLVAVHQNTTGEFTLCDFPLTFSGTTRHDIVTVCNTSAHKTTYVVLAEMTNALYELKSARKLNSNYKMFSVQPTEGRIPPFQELKLIVTYKPSIEYEEKGWKFVEDNWLQKSHFCFLKIVMVEVKDHIDFDGVENNSELDIKDNDEDNEWYPEDKSLLSYDTENFSNSQGFRLCLHGLFTTAVLEVTPGRVSYGDLRLGAVASCQATVTNRSLLKLGYRAVVPSYVSLSPEVQFIEAGSSVIIHVTVCAHAIGTFKRVVKLECLSVENFNESSGRRIVIGETKFIVDGDVKAITKKPQPKLNMGITPKIIQEVGFLPEEVTFGSKDVQMPSKAVVAVKGGLPRMYNSSDVVAFPNDMARSLRAHHPDKLFRSIFTGKERYIPPIDCCFTYTQLEKLKLNKHNAFWLNYMRNEFEKYQKKMKKGLEITDNGLTMKDLQRLNAVAPLDHPARKMSLLQQRQRGHALSPLELYNIKVHPIMLDFFMVAVDTDCEELMYVENLNNFAITIQVISTSSSIRVNGNSNLQINSYEKKTFPIVIHSSTLGVYSGMFKYVINEKYMFEMVVTAEIVEKSLQISTQEVRFFEPKNNPFYTWTEYITLKNNLKSDTAFSWTSKSFRCFDIQPKKGTVPSKSEMNCAITHRPSSIMETSSKISLLINNNTMDSIKCYSTLGRPQTRFINPVLNMGAIPLNLRTVAKSVLFNGSYRKVHFSVPTSQDMLKDMLISVSPTEGFIEERADVIFTFTFTVNKIEAIDHQFEVNCEDGVAYLKVVGEVVFPKVLITPEKFHLLRAPLFKHTVFMFTAENQSKAKANIAFLVDQFYHFKISLSPEYGTFNTINSFSLLPEATRTFYLHFFPTDLATHEFYLPVVINNIIGPPVIKMPKTFTAGYFINQNQELKKTNSSEKIPCVLILCTVAPPPLNFSKVIVKCVGDDEEDDIVISNNQDTTAHVGLQLLSSKNSQRGFSLKCHKIAFFIDKREKIYFYKILPGDSIKLIISFSPPEKGFYEEKLLVYHTLDESDVMKLWIDQPYSELLLQGRSTGSLIASDPTIYFPPIPLDVESIRKFTITKDNYYDDKELSLRVNRLDRAMEETLHVSYSDQTVVTKKKLSMQITIGFKSSHPISYKTQLIFRDAIGGHVAVTVIATADNCLLTTHAFSSLKYKSEASNENLTKNGPTPYNNVEFVKRSSSMTALESQHDSLSRSKSGLDRRAIKSQTSLLGSQKNIFPQRTSSFISHTKTLKYQPVQWQSLPEFPDESDPAADYLHMRSVRDSMERYLFGQTFNCSYYWSIGCNVKWSSAYKPAEQGAALSNVGLIKSLVELLERFCGRDIHTVLPYINIPFPKDDESRVLKVVSLLESVIDYLLKLGACLGHFGPEDLLDYYDYEILRKNKARHEIKRASSTDSRKSSTAGYFEIILNTESISKEKFEKRMVQCWLDLFLQLYKVCILFSIKPNSYKEYLSKFNASKEEANRNTYKLILKDKTNYNKINQNIAKESKKPRFRVVSLERSLSETILLAWLDDYFTKQRTVVWKNDPPEIRSLDFFDSLSDSLVFAAVTSFYCSYISSMYFENMFTHPKGQDQLYHNAICLLKAWNSIRLDLFVHASELIDDNNCILKMMVAVHLFKVLPSYVPEAVLDFNTPLTTSKHVPIQLTNYSLSPANYFLIMIGDPYGRFVVQSLSNVINIKSKNKVIINIQYTSNKIGKETATLLFCGCSVPPHFAANRVFTLEGYAQTLKISKVFNLEAPLNKIVNKTFKLNAPYGSSTPYNTFELRYSEKMPTVDDRLKYTPWLEISNRKLPQRIHFPHSSLSIPGKGRKTKEYTIKICCFTPKRFDYYFILMNPSVGDFIIQISIKPKVTVVKEPIELYFYGNASIRTECEEQFSDFTSKHSQTNPPNAVIKIPYRNNDLWTSVMAMFELKFDSNEKSFWTSYLETNIGLKLIQWMIGDVRDSMTDEISHIFHSRVNYKVSCSSQSLITPSVLHLSDVKLKSTIDFPVYVNKDDVESLKELKLSLTAEHGNEIRVYNVVQSEDCKTQSEE